MLQVVSMEEALVKVRDFTMPVNYEWGTGFNPNKQQFNRYTEPGTHFADHDDVLIVRFHNKTRVSFAVFKNDCANIAHNCPRLVSTLKIDRNGTITLQAGTTRAGSTDTLLWSRVSDSVYTASYFDKNWPVQTLIRNLLEDHANHIQVFDAAWVYLSILPYVYAYIYYAVVYSHVNLMSIRPTDINF